MRFPLRLIPNNTKIDFISHRWAAFAFSLVISILSIYGLFTKGLNYGVDFNGGIVLEIKSPNPINTDDIRKLMIKNAYHSATIQALGKDDNVLIRFQAHDATKAQSEITLAKHELTSLLGASIEFRKTDFVGPKVGEELVEKAYLAVVLAIVGILIYIGFRFNWQFGIGAVISLLHDAIVTLGFFVYSQLEFDVSSIAAILTVLGYSINDTVVIYDRIRENLKKYKISEFKKILNLSINETLSRTVMTVMTTLLVCLALVLYGGDVIHGFSLAMLFGIAFGTYSSIYIAAPMLLYTDKKK